MRDLRSNKKGMVTNKKQNFGRITGQTNQGKSHTSPLAYGNLI
jgi:hypothetical protein